MQSHIPLVVSWVHVFSTLAGAAIPTVQMGPVTNFEASATLNAPNPTSDQISIIGGISGSTNSRSEGLIFYLGPGVQASVKNAIAQSCQQRSSPGCQNAVMEALNGKSNETSLQVRQLAPLWVVSILVAGVAWAVGELHERNKQISAVRMPSPQLTQLASITTDSTVVFASGSNDPSAVTVTMTGPTPVSATTTGPVAAVSTASDGDSVITIPRNVAEILNSVLDSTICHRAVGIECVSRGSTSIIEYTKTHPNIFNQLRPLVVINIAPLADKAVQLAIDELANTAKGVAELSDGQLMGYATAIFFLVYSRFVLHHGPMTQATVAADAISIATSSAAPSRSSTPCPPEDRIPVCSNCGGRIPFVPELSKCLGVGARRVLGRCDCIDGSQYDYYKPRTFDPAAQAILANLPNLQPYDGKCAANISQVQNTYGGSTVIPYQYGVDLYDPMGTRIGLSDKQVASESKPLDVTSQLPHVFIVKPLGTGETVHFLYTDVKWDDSDDDRKKEGYCDQSTWSGTRPPVNRAYFNGKPVLCLQIFRQENCAAISLVDMIYIGISLAKHAR